MRWVKSGKITGAELVEEARGPVWYIPRSALKNFEEPKIGRPATKKEAVK